DYEYLRDTLQGYQEIGAMTILRSEEHTSNLQSLTNLVCRLLLEKKRLLVSAANPLMYARSVRGTMKPHAAYRDQAVGSPRRPFFLMIRRPPRSTLFPHPALSR